MSILDVLHDEENQGGYGDLFLGVTVGVVTDIDDPEKLGRLKVRILNRDKSDYETDFIRVMTPMAGKKWGSFFFPEVGDEVLLAFNQGDINRPYVLGALWNKEYPPPAAIENQQNHIRKVKTKSGHEIIFDDENEKESITVKTPKELSLTLDDQNEIIKITDAQGNNLISIDSQKGEIKVTGENKLSLLSGRSSVTLDSQKNSVDLESGQSLNIKAQQINIKANTSLNLQGGTELTAQSSGKTNISGTIVKIN